MSKEYKPFRHNPTPCPYCGYKLDSAGARDNSGKSPRPGDLSVCLNCAGILIYERPTEGELRLKKLSGEDLAALAVLEPETVKKLMFLSQEIKAFNLKNPRK